MTIAYRVWDFPTFPVSKQLFHVPGASVEGGFTTGGARISSPDVGGRAVLELQPSLQFGEWEFPLSSWIMSKINGEIFTVRLAPTPQVLSVRGINAANWQPDTPWSNNQPWAGDLFAHYIANALEGSNVVIIDMSGIGQRLQPGHVVGHNNNTYVVDEINYEDDIATVVVKPPLRRNIIVGDTTYFRPYFTGSISNGSDVRTTYDAINNGSIQPGLIVFNEVILP